MMPKRLLTAAAMFSLALGCAAHEDPDSKAPKPRVEEPVATQPPEADPVPEVVVAQASIASVQLNENCPDPPEAEEKAKSAAAPAKPVAPSANDEDLPAWMPAQGAVSAKMARMAPGSGPLEQPCTQSTMQLAFVGQGEETAKVVIKEVRLLQAEGANRIGKIDARKPSLWVEGGGYEPWDETLGASTDVKASYKLGEPDWAAVEKALGGDSFGPMYMLEVDIEIGGQLQTVRSSEFPRERPIRIVT